MHMDRSNRLTYCIIILFFAGLIFLTGCGGGGGGGGDATDTPDTDPPTTTPTQTQAEFSQTVVNHFQDKNLTIQNQGTSDRTIGDVAQTDPLAAPFSIIADQCANTTLAPSESCAITVRFSPTTQDDFEDTFDIQTEGSQTMMIVSLSGTSRALNASISQVDTSGCPTIRMFVSVTDSNDAPVSNLTQDDFLISEDGIPKSIVSFSNTASSPISVAILMDSSNSIQPYADNIEAAAISFLDQLSLDAGTDEAAIIKFATTYEIKQSFTDVKDLLTQAIGTAYTGNGGETHLYDTIWQAVDLASDPARNDRRAVVLISDGHDEGSVDHDLAAVIANANESGVPVFAIGLGDTYIASMQQLADGTGGQYFVAPTSSDLEDIYQQIAQILSNQYVIEYQSAFSDGADIELNVDVDLSGDLGEDTKTVPGCAP